MSQSDEPTKTTISERIKIRNRSKILLPILGVIDGAILAFAGVLVSVNHKISGVWILFVGLALLSAIITLYLSDTPRVRLLFATLIIVSLAVCLYLHYSVTNEPIPLSKERPYIVMSDVRFNSPISSGEPPFAIGTMKNVGQKPALDLTIKLYSTMLKGELKKQAEQGIMPDTPPIVNQSSGIIAPNEFGHFIADPLIAKNEMEKELMMKGELVYFFWGEINYTDDNNKPHFLKFCYRSFDINSSSLVLCPKGGKADKN